MENFFNIDSIQDNYDLVIIGAGPAGCTAAIYASRDELSTLVLEKFGPGGQMSTTSYVENYPGFDESINGGELAEKFFKQASNFGAVFRYGNCSKMEMNGNYKLLYIDGRDRPIRTKTVIIATGCTPKKLDVPGENKFLGRGVSSCATCDGGFYKDKIVLAVGGGNTALEESDYLTRFASKVYLVHRRKEFRGNKTSEKLVRENDKIELILDSVVTDIYGDSSVEYVSVKNLITGEAMKINVDGVFIFIGQQPQSHPFDNYIEHDSLGFFIADETTATKLPGVFVAGDVRAKEIRQIATAVSDGAVSAKMAVKFIQEMSLL